MRTEVPLTPTAPLFAVGAGTPSSPVTLHFEGRAFTVPAGTSLAAALLLNGVGAFRSTPVRGQPRAAYCMMGVCFDCLVEVDGVPGCQACLVPVRDGMVVLRQQGAAAPALPSAGGADGP